MFQARHFTAIDGDIIGDSPQSILIFRCDTGALHYCFLAEWRDAAGYFIIAANASRLRPSATNALAHGRLQRRQRRDA